MFARKLAPEHDLLLIARRGDRLGALATELERDFGARVETEIADLTVAEDLQRVAQRLRSREDLVLLVNNAGFGSKGLFWEASLESQEKMHQLHVMATMQLTHAILPKLVASDRGGVINVASVSAFVTNPGAVSYAATKSWMTRFTEGLYLELKQARSNVVVQALCPGFTYSEFHDAMQVERTSMAGRGMWMSAEYVVEASLEGLRSRKLFVIPGWRYRLLTAFLTKLPTAARLALEAAVGQKRRRQVHGG